MKNIFYLTVLLTFALPGLKVTSQHISRQPACYDTLILHQADSIKQYFFRQGFIIIKEASMSMESENEIPVIVPLIAGTFYQFVFIGDLSSKSYEVRMFDWDEKQVAYQKKQLSKGEGNVISYAYTPRSSEYHLLKPVQVNKTKNYLCGYLMLLKKIKQYQIYNTGRHGPQ